jgi:hypothetical protein
VHEHVSVSGRALTLYDRWIEHFGLVVYSREEREAKCKQYLALRPDYDLSHFYLFEDQEISLLPLTTSASVAAELLGESKAYDRSFILYNPGSDLDFRAGGNAVSYTLGGWSAPESWGTWTVDDESHLCLPLERPMGREATLSVTVHPYVTPAHPVCRVQVLCFGELIDEWTLTTPAEVERHVLIPARNIASHHSPWFTFRVLNPISPHEVCGSADRRRLGLGFRRVRLAPGYPAGTKRGLRG